MIINTPEKIDLYRMSVLEKMLRLELLGINMYRGSQPTAYSVIKKEYNLKGNRQKVYDTFKEMIETTKQQERE